MSKKKRSGKAMPILSIVFFGVSMILFAAKAAASIVFRMVFERSDYLHIVLAEVGKTIIFVFPAVFFIICAAIYLRRSLNYRKMLTVSFAMQCLSAVLLSGRLVYVQRIYGFQNTSLITYFLLACLGLIALFSLICAVLEAKHSRKKALVIIIAACGFVFALVMGCSYLFPVIKDFNFYSEHLALLLHRVVDGLLYTIAIIFYYVALLMTAFYKVEFEKVPEKVKVVLKTK